MANPIKRLINYLKSSYVEIRKVQWPSPKDTWRYSVLVIVVSAAVTAFLAVVDFVFGGAINLLP